MTRAAATDPRHEPMLSCVNDKNHRRSRAADMEEVHMIRGLIFCLSLCALFSVEVARAAAAPASNPLTTALKWRMIGPYRGGRTRAVAGVPAKPNVFYIGAVDGGVWRTDDA